MNVVSAHIAFDMLPVRLGFLFRHFYEVIVTAFWFAGPHGPDPDRRCVPQLCRLPFGIFSIGPKKCAWVIFLFTSRTDPWFWPFFHKSHVMGVLVLLFICGGKFLDILIKKIAVWVWVRVRVASKISSKTKSKYKPKNNPYSLLQQCLSGSPTKKAGFDRNVLTFYIWVVLHAEMELVRLGSARGVPRRLQMGANPPLGRGLCVIGMVPLFIPGLDNISFALNPQKITNTQKNLLICFTYCIKISKRISHANIALCQSCLCRKTSFPFCHQDRSWPQIATGLGTYEIQNVSIRVTMEKTLQPATI